MVLYGITLVPLADELRAADPGLLSSFYANDAAFDGSARCSAQLLNLLMKRGPEQGYFPKPAKSLFISDSPGQEEAEKRDFTKDGLVLNYVSRNRYLGAYLGPQAELEAWVKPSTENSCFAAASFPGVSEMKRDLAGSGKYPRSGPPPHQQL